MRILAIGLSATSITSAPADARVSAAATSLPTSNDRGGSISTATTKSPLTSFDSQHGARGRGSRSVLGLDPPRRRRHPRPGCAAPDRLRDRQRVSRPGPATSADDRTPSSRNARACSARYSGVAGYTNRPPTCVGPPAFGRATSGTAPAAGRMRCITRSSCAGPSPQFAPIASAPSSVRRSATCTGEDPRSVRSSLVKVALTATAMPGRTLAGGAERLLHLQQVRLRLDDQEIDAPLRQGGGLLAIRRERILRSHPAVRRQPNPERPHGTRDEARPCVPSERRGGAVQLAGPLGEAVDVQAVSVATERVREDDVGTRVDERAMDGDDPLGSLDVQQLETCADGLALFDQRRAHAAVGQERAVGEERSEGRAVHRAQCRSPGRAHRRGRARAARRRGVASFTGGG